MNKFHRRVLAQDVYLCCGGSSVLGNRLQPTRWETNNSSHWAPIEPRNFLLNLICRSFTNHELSSLSCPLSKSMSWQLRQGQARCASQIVVFEYLPTKSSGALHGLASDALLTLSANPMSPQSTLRSSVLHVDLRTALLRRHIREPAILRGQFKTRAGASFTTEYGVLSFPRRHVGVCVFLLYFPWLGREWCYESAICLIQQIDV